MPRLEKMVVIGAPVSKVWKLASDPSRWHTWFEGATEARSIQGEGGVGTVVEHGITVHNIPMPIKTTVVTFDPGVCWKAEFSGPMTKGFQQWDYKPAGAGTELSVTVETELSGPAKLAQKMVVSAFEDMFDKTLANIKGIAES